jgi:hypothetical protein
MQFTIDDELKDYLPAGGELSDARLETLLLRDGLSAPLSIWKEKNILIDGHRRLKILNKHGIKPRFDLKSFPDRESVKHWMDTQALGQCRRLNEMELKEVTFRSAAFDTRPRAEVYADLAKKTDRSERQVQRDIEQGKALAALPPDLKKRITSGEVKATASDLEELASLPEERQRQVFNELDAEKVNKLSIILNDEDTEDGTELEFEPEKPKKKKAKSKVSGGTSFNVEELEPADVKDGLGNEPPASLRDVFGKAPEFDEQRNALTQIKKWFNLIRTHAAGALIEQGYQRLLTDLNNLDAEIKFAKPHAVCPYCQNKSPKVIHCEACKGAGWVSKEVYDACPKEMKHAG